MTESQEELIRIVDTTADRLAHFMESRHMTQSQLAEQLGVSRATISHWLTGHIVMPQVAAMALQVVFGVRWEWMLRGEAPLLCGDQTAMIPEVAEIVLLLSECEVEQRKRIANNIKAMIFLLKKLDRESNALIGRL